MSKSKKSPKRAAALSKDQLAAIVKRISSGESALIEESKRAGLTPNTPLRNALRAHLGGAKPYRAMIEKGMEARAKKSSDKEEKTRLKKAA